MQREITIAPSPMNVNQPEDNQEMPLKLESCCFRIDRNMAVCVVSTTIVLTSVGLSVIKLATSDECVATTPYYILLSNIGSLAAGALFSLAKIRYPAPQQQNRSNFSKH